MDPAKIAAELTAPELGELFGCDPRAIRSLASRGIMQRTRHGRYKAAESIRAYVVHLREQAAGRIGHDPSIDIVRENALLRRARRRMIEIKYERLSGSLISMRRSRRSGAVFWLMCGPSPLQFRTERGRLSRTFH